MEFNMYNRIHEEYDLNPHSVIVEIPKFKTKYGYLTIEDEEFIKQKLLKAESNNQIIRLARGESRSVILDNIVSNPDIIFDWGIKSMHALYYNSENSELRDFLEPNQIDKELLKRLLYRYKRKLLELHKDEKKRLENMQQNHLEKYKNRLDKINEWKEKYPNRRCPFDIIRFSESGINQSINTIENAIDNEDNYQNLIIIKEFLCYSLHISGYSKYKDISPWVSTSEGYNRYFYARKFMSSKNSENINRQNTKRGIILDYWVDKCEDGHAYRSTNHIVRKLREIGIPWYRNKYNEVMVKYALYPHQLVGYYYFEDNELKHYVVNHHYVDMWKENPQFNIGDYVYIDQGNVDFPADNPYKVVYSKYDFGRYISIHNKIW
ncbi:hypothetical protein [Clostridioides difficile]|uniref:hypothetical protein n=2 Tax=Clostridioides difficile TaxID=1496 RepID=UPI00097FE47B|nr:hypothetical protein [Clostridioides difficile]SJT06179.1 Uncharacterised protein [Clostridioides difficile]SJT09189.1 Uncharacterised protein [Clostridioides difficile]SJT55687.1 Uncharacterised protein [Clostridioides difficile]HBH3576013.1 hypothetical protein [Clostridioides difficile]